MFQKFNEFRKILNLTFNMFRFIFQKKNTNKWFLDPLGLYFSIKKPPNQQMCVFFTQLDVSVCERRNHTGNREKMFGLVSTLFFIFSHGSLRTRNQKMNWIFTEMNRKIEEFTAKQWVRWLDRGGLFRWFLVVFDYFLREKSEIFWGNG